jgi:hypothetical protein
MLHDEKERSFKYFPTDLPKHASTQRKQRSRARVLISTAIVGHACSGSEQGTTFFAHATGTR